LNTKPLIPIHYIAQISDYLQECGIDREAWLAHFGLTPSSLLEAGLLIDFKHYEQIILSAVNKCQRADIGLSIGKKLSINNHGILGFALLNCTTLRQAIELCQRYVGIRTPLLELTLVDEAEQYVIEINELVNIHSIRQVFIESLLVTLEQSLRFVVGHGRIFKKLEFNFSKPKYWLDYRGVFSCESEFCAEKCRLFIDATLLDTPLSGRDPQSFAQAEALCRAELEHVKLNRQLAGQVHTMLLMSEPKNRRLSVIAKKLHLTPRTLHRHLLLEGRQFKELLEQVRCEQAKTLLSEGQPVKAVAYILGYSDSANFRRAFKRWLSMTPQEFIKDAIKSRGTALITTGLR
jgi:AraC-like DNA-binding protein